MRPFVLKMAYTNGILTVALDENEQEIGKIFQEQRIVPRENLYITSKLWNTHHQPNLVARAIRKSLKDLRLEYLDLYLMHWPVAFNYIDDDTLWPKDAQGAPLLDNTCEIEDTWKAMETLVDEGKTRAIGVSNFNITRLKRILAIARHKPVVNQVLDIIFSSVSPTPKKG